MMSNKKLTRYNSLPVIIGENDDEMFIIGTKNELSLLANTILEFINSSQNDDTHSLCDKKVCNFPIRITDELGSIVLDGIVMTNSEEDKKLIVNEYLKNDGNLPIDWVNRKKLRNDIN